METFVTDYSFAIILIIIGFLTLLLWNRKRKNHLPEPFGWPIIGHYFLMNNNPGKNLAKLAEKYGSVYKINIGRIPYVVINGYKANKETLNDKPLIFADRPNTFAFRVLFQGGIDFAGPWDEKFKQARKATVRALGITASVRASYFEKRLQQACDKFIEDLNSNCQDKFINPEKELIQMMGHVISGVLFGKLSPDAYSEEYYELLFKLSRFETEFNDMAFVDSFPILELFYGNYNFRAKKSLKVFKDFFLKQIEKHEKSDIENVPNVLDNILEFHKKENSSNYANYLAGHMIFLLEGGVETVPSSCLWFLLCMSAYPDIQERLHKHIKDIVGDKPIDWNDLNKLPYLEASILEMHRYATLTPIGFFHATTEDTSYNGYDIPKGMGVISNLWSIHNDKTVWENPESFNPDRFLKPGSEELNSALAGKITVFSIGRRRCVGENMSKLIMSVFIGRVMQLFKIQTDGKLEDSVAKLALFCCKISLIRPMPYGIKATPR